VVGEIEVLLSGAEELLLGLAGRIDRGEQVPASRALGARTLADRQVVAAVQLALRLLGNPGLSQHNPLERHFRDVQVLKQHGFASVNRYETVSQVYFGLAPEFAPVAL